MERVAGSTLSVPQPLDTAHLAFGVNNGVRVPVAAHLAGAKRVMNRDRGCADIGVDFRIRPAIRSRSGFRRDKRRERRLAANLAR